MVDDGHLRLQEVLVPAGREHALAREGLLFVQIQAGTGYLLPAPQLETAAPGDVFVVCAGNLVVRASQIGDLRLRLFTVVPQRLGALLNVREMQSLDALARKPATTPRAFRAGHPLAARFAALPAAKPDAGLPLRGQMLQIFCEALADVIPPVSVNSCDASGAGAEARFEKLISEKTVDELAQAPADELAHRCGCSVRHFNRLFRRRFGVSLRAQQIALRLQRAQQLLRESDSKVTEVAFESGFRHTGLFNTLFKRQFGMTPSEWRTQGVRKRAVRRFTVAACMLVSLACLFPSLVRAAEEPKLVAAASAAPTPAGVTSTNSPATNAPAKTFQVLGYDITGNTVLPLDVLAKVLTDHTGPAATFDTIRAALTELQLAYRGRGYVTVKVALPQQQITNGYVKVDVIEGRLTDIQVTENNWFGEKNVLRALPSVRSNAILNSITFQQELDRANSSRDRQIYPVIGPGPEPGTTALTLKVKDSIPLHGRVELNNQSTPGSPAFRLNSSIQYNNLWDLDHQIGFQYGGSPDRFNAGSTLPRFYDQPLVANASAFYRLPLSGGAAERIRSEVKAADFGFDEVNRRFVPPALSGLTELIVFASHSHSDTGTKFGPVTIAAATPLVTIASQPSGDDRTINDSVGARLTVPLVENEKLRSTFSFGPDLKHYLLVSHNTNTFLTTTIITNSFGQETIISSAVPFAQPDTRRELNYLPFTASLDTFVPDKWGGTSLTIGGSINPGIFSTDQGFAAAGYSPATRANYGLLNAGFARDQRLWGEWSLQVRANGQWTDQPLISNEQFGLGGTQGVRGYQEGEEYGDSGWRLLTDLRTPLLFLGYLDTVKHPTRARAFLFTDYGQRFLADDSPGRARRLDMWGCGVGFTITVEQFFEARFTYAMPLLDTPNAPAHVGRAYFTLAAQF